MFQISLNLLLIAMDLLLIETVVVSKFLAAWCIAKPQIRDICRLVVLAARISARAALPSLVSQPDQDCACTAAPTEVSRVHCRSPFLPTAFSRMTRLRSLELSQCGISMERSGNKSEVNTAQNRIEFVLCRNQLN